MPKLNNDILQEIFIESIKKNTFKSMPNFMLSGKEPMNIALKYFSKAQSAEVHDGKILVYFIDRNGSTKQYKISYDIPCLKIVLTVIGASINELDVHSRCSLIKKHKILDYLIGNRLKELFLFTTLPQKFNQRLSLDFNKIIVHISK